MDIAVIPVSDCAGVNGAPFILFILFSYRRVDAGSSLVTVVTSVLGQQGETPQWFSDITGMVLCLWKIDEHI